jgi:purine-cytosine permease-like protein
MTNNSATQIASPTQIEGHGIDLIPDEKRHGRPWELFPIWFGMNVVFTNLLVGGLLVVIGLPLAVAFVIAIVGNLAWGLVGVLATVGPKTGTATAVVSRAQYGRHGTKVPAVLTWAVMVGYEGIAFAIAALGAYSLADYWGWELSTAAKAAVLLVLIFCAFIVALFGKALIFLTQKIIAVPLAVALTMFAAYVLPEVDWSYQPEFPLSGGAGVAVVLIGISLVLSIPLAYTSPADVSRYLPRSTSSRAVALATALGCFIPTVFLMVVGILAATVVDPTDFTNSMRSVLPGWFYPIFLIIVVVGILANAMGAIYSAGLALQTAGVKMSRPKTVWLDGAIGASIAFFGVLVASNFLEVLQNFLLWSIFWAAPYYGIWMVDLWARRGKYDSQALFERSGRYWYRKGVRWPAIASLLLGVTVSALLSNTPYLQGYLSTEFLQGGDLSAVGGFVVGGLAYWLSCVRPERQRDLNEASAENTKRTQVARESAI